MDRAGGVCAEGAWAVYGMLMVVQDSVCAAESTSASLCRPCEGVERCWHSVAGSGSL